MHGLSIDVEDWFHAANLNSAIPTTSWDKLPSRLKTNLYRLLDLCDEFNVKGTFFVLGWVTDRYPDLVKEICRRNHEIACHGPGHHLVYDLTPDEFHNSLKIEKDRLESLIGKSIEGYRAPNFSITTKSWWCIEILAELGFRYDSSIFPFRRKRYGVPQAPLGIFRLRVSECKQLIELPPSVTKILGARLPIAGGGYFRLLPGSAFMAFVSRLESEDRPLIFYIHPWEIDPGQPHPRGIPLHYRTMHYLNLGTTYRKLKTLLSQFPFTTLSEIASGNSQAPFWSPA